MKLRTAGCVLLCAVVFAGCSGMWPFIRQDGYVKVRGTHFTQNDKPYYYVGTNMWYGCYLGSPGETGDRPRLERELDSLNELGVTNLRILAGSEFSQSLRAVKPAILREPGVVDDSLLLGLDYMLSQMAKRHMKAVLYLTNYWEWSGGMSQYVAWAEKTPSLDPEVAGWGTFMNYSAGFYKHEAANAMFRTYVKSVVTRVNAYNHRTYSTDPAIMSWQLANEPRPGTESPEGTGNLPFYFQWIDKTAGFIKSLDTNHLVSTGSEGIAGSLQSEEYYLAAHTTKNIDYCTMHVWPFNWGWFDPKKFEETLPFAQQKALDYLATHVRLARRLQKPLVVEEFGLGRDTGSFVPGSPTTARDRYFTTLLGVIYDSARTGSPLAGSNFWAWGGEGRTQNADAMWKKGDSFVGDPPQEPQGVNSIFDTDVSTLAVLREHALRMRKLGTDDSLLVPVAMVKR